MKKEEELEKEGLEPATLQQEEEGKGVSKSGRQLVMEKLMVAAAGKMESRVILLTNMVGPEDVDEDLQEDVEQECNKYGKVDHIVIYQVRIPLLSTNLTQLPRRSKTSLKMLRSWSKFSSSLKRASALRKPKMVSTEDFLLAKLSRPLFTTKCSLTNKTTLTRAISLILVINVHSPLVSAQGVEAEASIKATH